jgi:tetratricopeptide (TPR) repeat protein
MTHGYFIYSDTQRVPFIVSAPGRVPAGRTVENVVRAVDVAPTILELAGLPALSDAEGRSLVRLMAGRGDAGPGPAYLESFHPRIWWGAQELLALRTGRWLYIDAPRPELYDVSSDPGERANLAATLPGELETLRRQLRSYAQPGASIGAQTRLDAEATARLRSLGYLGSRGPDPNAVGKDLPDAKDNGPLLAAVSRGQELVVQRRMPEALAQFREALTKNPRAVSVQMSMADTLFALGRYDEAISEYADVAAGGGALDVAYVGMSKARLAQGQPEAALAVTQAGLDLRPDSVLLNAQHGELLLRLGRPVEAERAFRRALAVIREDESARWGLGVALSKQGRTRESVEVMLALAVASPRAPQSRAAAEALERWADDRLAARVPADARRGYEAVVGTGRASEALFLNLGLALWQLGLPSETLAVLDRGSSHFPRSAELHYRRGRVLQHLGRQAEAASAFRRVLELDSGHSQAAAALSNR